MAGRFALIPCFSPASMGRECANSMSFLEKKGEHIHPQPPCSNVSTARDTPV